MSLSFCIIVKNEETTLPRCLKSVKPVVDEMVVLDTGSTDRTPEIAQEFGAKVHHFAWQDDFAAARNESLKYAEGDWILVLDADEVLVPEAIPLLRQALSLERHILINLIRHEVGATQSPYSLVSRLFRKHPDLYFSRPYHAMVDDSIEKLLRREPDWKIGALNQIAILHEGYQAGSIVAKNKLQRAKAAMESYLAQNPTDAYVCSKLGALYIEIGNLDRGIQLLERAIAKSSPELPILYELHYHLGIAYRQRNQLAKAKGHYRAATSLTILPLMKLGAYINLGNLFKDEGDFKAAKDIYEIALQIDPNLTIAHYNLAMTLKAMGLFVDAIKFYKKAIRLHPNYAEAYQNLGVVLLKVGQVPESLEAFGKAIAIYESRNPSEAARLRQGLQEMGFQI